MPKVKEMLEEGNPERDYLLDQLPVYRGDNTGIPLECYGRNGLLTELERRLGYGKAPRSDQGRF